MINFHRRVRQATATAWSARPISRLLKESKTQATAAFVPGHRWQARFSVKMSKLSAFPCRQDLGTDRQKRSSLAEMADAINLRLAGKNFVIL